MEKIPTTSPLGPGETFHCNQCGLRTPGIIHKDRDSEARWCPACDTRLYPPENRAREKLLQKKLANTILLSGKEIVLSGIRATGKLHFGNFLGAIKQFVQYQGKQNHVCLYFIADWHTLTTHPDPEQIRSNRLEIVKDYIAAGVDPNRSLIYAQSSIPEISEIALYHAMLQPFGDLQTIPTFKEKVRKHPNAINLGLFSYPVLMAADILGPQASVVPVGEDQVPNVELARSLARKFNTKYETLFNIPRISVETKRVPGLDGNKMGKSESENAISLTESMGSIRKRYRKHGVTDPERIRRDDPGDPYNRCKAIYPLHEILSKGEEETRVIANQCLAGTIGCADCKGILMDRIESVLIPFQERRKELGMQDDYAQDILDTSTVKVRALVQKTLENMRVSMGID